RIFAYLIDLTLLFFFFMGMKYLYYGGFDMANEEALRSHMGIDILTISVPMLLYSLVTEVLLHGQTLGKKFTHIRVMSLGGGEPELSQYMIRWMFKAFEWPFFFGYTIFTAQSIISYLMITGFLGIFVVIIIGISKKNQRLGDLAANTVVIFTQSQYSVEDTIFMDIQNENYEVKYPEVLNLSDRDINTINNVIQLYHKDHQMQTVVRVSYKVQEVLKIHTDQSSLDFLEKLLEDYNYLATR
ncbi:MAG: RDD family protein, partial [Bacteroidota bacterium]|nr:RDD family protein [Bacteroidota bacterium]